MNEDARERTRRREQRRGRTSQKRSRPLWPWVAGGALVLVALAYFGPIRAYDPKAAGGPASNAASTDDPRITLVAGAQAPDFTLSSVDGGVVRLSEQRGKTNVLLYFQEGIMCPPCWQQMRDLKRDADKLAALNIALITITVDPLDQLKATVPREQIEGMILLYDKDAAVARSYQALFVSMHPGQRPGHTFILVGTDGKILWRRDFREMYVPNPMILDPVAKALGK